ncbi:MAG TPA: hypothetical protein VGN12_09455 [Pirellulales bacterium]|jgi:hypothetical protein
MAKNKHVGSATRANGKAKVTKPTKLARRSKSASERAPTRMAKPKRSLGAGIRPAATLKNRVDQAAEKREPRPTAAEADAVRFAISVPGLLDSVREEAFIELGRVVQRTLEKHGVHLGESEAANVAWWIVGHPDDVPDA